MKRLLLLLTSISLLIGTSFAQSSVWTVEGKGNTLYLGGTIHILSPEDYPLPSEFDSAFAWSDIIVFETDIKKMEEPAVIQKMMSLAMYQDDRTLQGELSAEAYSLLEKKCSEVNVPLAGMQQFKPTMVLLLYTVTKMQQSGNTSDGVDQFYLAKALSNEKGLLYLETIESQLEFLFGEEGEDESLSVLQFFDDQDKWDNNLDELKAAWLDGEEKVFKNLQKEMRKEYPEIYQKMVVDRNENWISQIENYLDDERVEFILVGALHMHGPDGVLGMLKKEGYKIKQVK
jgi:uncharacterized protein YbaP (TraB family)